MSKPKSNHGVQDSFVPISRAKQRSRALIRAILIATAIEAPLLALAVCFLPVEAPGDTGQKHTIYSISALGKGSNIKMDLFLSELLAIAMIPTSAVLFTVLKYR